MKDLADVDIGKNIRTGSATYNGAEAVLGAALMLSGENSRIVAKRVDERSRRSEEAAARRRNHDCL